MPRPPAESVAATIEMDLPCIHCGYNLRTLQLESRCPECGKPVIDTLYHHPLIYAPTSVLRRIALGLWLGIMAAPIGAAAALVGDSAQRWAAVLHLFPVCSKGWSWVCRAGEFDEGLTFLRAVFPMALYALATWLVTTRDHRLPVPQGRFGSVLFCRLLTILTPILFWLEARGWLFGAAGLMALGDLFYLLVFLTYIQGIAEKAGAVDLARAITTGVMVVLATPLIGLAGGLIVLAAPALNPVVAALGAVTYLGAGVWIAIILHRLALRLWRYRVFEEVSA